ncbi:hypothetical protein J7M28_01225 [bacterium]|nr:hypothetical protein [bacterium]
MDERDYKRFELSQPYCAWRHILGLPNEQILIHLDVRLLPTDTGGPWASIYYGNPTKSRTVYLTAKVYVRAAPNVAFEFCKRYKDNLVRVNRHQADRFKIPLRRALADCDAQELELVFAFIGEDGRRKSNTAKITFSR